MENKNKNKKKLFAIIGASALAFVLTIALSVSITLAYFGGTASGTSSVTLGGSVFLGDANNQSITMNSAYTGAVPGQKIDVTVNGTVKSSSTQNAAVILLVKGDVTLDSTTTAWTKLTSVKVTQGSDNYTVYVYGTENSMTVVKATESGAELTQFKGTQTVSTTLDNGEADRVVTDAAVSVQMIAIQNGTESTDTAKSFSNLKEIFQTVGNITFTNTAE